MKNSIGILLTNVGTPDAPTTSAVKKYLKEFLSDKRVVTLPSIIWQPILRYIILPRRSPASAKLYQKIWQKEGSPQLLYVQALAHNLQNALNIPVEVGMHYGNPSIKNAIENLHSQKIKHLITLPLFPQFSETTTAVTFDAVLNLMKHYNFPVSFINNYATHPDYINALAKIIRASWKSHGKHHLLFSFHGIPLQRAYKDPYATQCKMTAHAIAKKLNLTTQEWDISFQSRLGPTKWLSPYTDKVLQELPKRNITQVDVICPGFSVDCLETLEEISIRGQETFLAAGGQNLHYIPALNASENHIVLLSSLINSLNGINENENYLAAEMF